MRKLIYPINLSIDGCFNHTIGVPGADLFEFYIQLVRNTGLMVYGRKTYQLMVPYWPDIAKNPVGKTKEEKEDYEYALAFDACAKVVFSRTLEQAEEKNTRIVRGGLKEEILALKNEPGKDILVGGVDIPSQLIELGLIDEYYFMVMPIIAVDGRRLMEGIDPQKKLQLRLIDTRTFGSGSVLLHYAKQ
jgi:dihydrofolate reductase